MFGVEVCAVQVLLLFVFLQDYIVYLCFYLAYDCPAWPGVYEYASFVAGASMLAAQCLVRGVADMAINWPGGWHHAKR